MGRNYYSEIHLHFVWHTKLSLPLLTPPVVAATRRFLRQKVFNTPGAYVHESGGTENHIYMAVTITPTIAIAEFIGQLKGSSAHDINQELGRGSKLLEWQAGYGVVSFGTKDLEWVVAYIRNRREHHAKGTVHERLERIEPEERLRAHSEKPRERGSNYLWRRITRRKRRA